MSEQYISENTQYEENSEDIAGLLLEFIQNYEFLYDMKNKDYKNSRKKEDAWKEIASILNISVDHCQRLWKSLRDKYTREKRNTGKSGSAAPKSNWVLFPKMSFYGKFSKPRQTFTSRSRQNLVLKSRPSSSCSSASSGRSVWSMLLSPEPQGANEGKEETLERGDLVCDNPGSSRIGQTTLKTSPQGVSKRKKRVADEEVNQFLELGRSLSSCNNTIHRNQTRPNDSNRSFCEYIFSVLNDNPPEKAKEIRRRFLQILLEENIN
ncbi:uncharacterized protein LOC130895475 [Diorhabda carinulata]|uniref:uncharacterized protein LOC130895475 n=1 Tax=Diorhabda carinulata TaxID=1163345 RepID=UPI0025A1E796|nr:uncharacterized protein LOC130895475 [Diorhabda carinulata]